MLEYLVSFHHKPPTLPFLVAGPEVEVRYGRHHCSTHRVLISTVAAEELPTDVNLVTALDVSDSIMRHEAWIEFEGIARAVTAPAFLEAIARGRHRRIGFAVFTWSNGRHFRVIVPWTTIGSPAGAESVALALRGAPRPSPGGGGDHDEASGVEYPVRSSDGRTDISGAIEFGAGLMASAPPSASRRVLNIVGNGVDNVGASPVHARRQALLAEITINAVVLRRDSALLGYFRERVIGGSDLSSSRPGIRRISRRP